MKILKTYTHTHIYIFFNPHFRFLTKRVKAVTKLIKIFIQNLTYEQKSSPYLLSAFKKIIKNVLYVTLILCMDYNTILKGCFLFKQSRRIFL